MGYETGFEGQIDFDKPLTKKHCETLIEFTESWIQDEESEEERVSDGRPSPFPCHWHPGIKGKPVIKARKGCDCLVFGFNNKFPYYEEWLIFLVEKIKLWGYVLNGEIDWYGDDEDDLGTMYVKDNEFNSVPWKGEP